MSESPDNHVEEADGELAPLEGEQVSEARPLPVPFEAPQVQPVVARRATVPATVAAAGGGFMLGVAAFMLLKVLRRPAAAGSLSRRRSRLIARRRGVDVAASKSFLVDVHMLKR